MILENMPVIFRPHRGSLAAAMSERCVFTCRDQMLRHISCVYGYDLCSLYVDDSCYSLRDDRIGWSLIYLVMCRFMDSDGVIRSYPIGWCSNEFTSFDWEVT